MKRQYTIYNICVLLALLFLGGGWNDAWGQEYNNGWNSEEDKTVWDKQTNLPNSVIGTSTETIYVIDGESFQLHLQDGAPLSGGVRDNFNGYIRWYNNATEEGSTANLSANATTLLRKYKNGFYWAQAMGWGAGPAAPAGLITYKNSSIDDNNPETIVCEASSLTDYKYVEDSNRRRHYLTEGATVNVRKHFIIKSATNREDFLSARKENFSSEPWYTSLATSLEKEHIQSIQDRTTGFPEVYEVHTPMEAGTSYRLAQRLSNYIVKIDSKEYHANQVRWRVFDSDGSRVTDSHCNIVRHNWNGNKKYEFEEIQMTNGSIILGESSYIDEKRESVGYQSEYNKPNIINFYYNLAGVDKTKQQHFYIMAEVRYYQEEKDEDETTITTQSDWYPISFITVYLEPNSEPLDDNNLPEDRKPATLADDNAYKLLASMTFDDTDTSKPTADTNYPSSDNVTLLNTLFGSDSETYYGFAMPDKYRLKKNNTKEGNRFVGRGEYAFYKSLNIEGISPGENQSTDIYYANWPSKSYQVKVTDRLHESKGHPDGSDYGYFLYVDAADEAGLIAKLRFTEKLCQRTSLVGTAWICNLKATDEDGQSALNADIGFTLKGLTLNEDGTYTESAPLYKFYTGEVKNNPVTGTGFEAYAKWQQVYFKFNINENYDYDAYIVEVANNCRNSHGADYAVDQIEIRCTLPDITVQRENACESSTLRVSSDYNTLLQNMGWDVNPNVLDNVVLKDNPAVRKFRYGLMGTKADWFGGNLDNVPVESTKLGNVYFGFVNNSNVTGEDPNDWITVNKRAMDNTGVDPEKYALYKSIRVAVPTDETFGANYDGYIPNNPEDALRREYILNVRAVHDFVNDKDNWVGQTISVDLEKALETLWVDDDVNIDVILSNKNNAKELYENSVIELFNYLGIPRIRCPWIDSDGTTLYLHAIDVENTDLRFKGEIYDDNGTSKIADGIYWVVIFSATDVLNASEGNPAVVVNNDCTLKSEFYVVPSVTITVDTKTETGGMTCIGSIHTLSADLMVADVDEFGNVVSANMLPFDEKYPSGSYTFDWFLGSESDYQKQTVDGKDLQSIISVLRVKLNNPTGSFDAEDVDNSNLSEEEKALLKKLLGDETHEPLLVTGKSVSFRWVEKVVAIPYVPNIESDDVIKLFCIKPQEITLDSESNVPELSFGFSGVDYPDDKTIPDDVKLFNAPLRLGLRHIKDGSSLSNIPIRDEIVFGVDGDNHSLQELPEGRRRSILLRNSPSVYTEVAELSSLYVDKNKENDSEKPNVLSFEFKEQQNGVKLADLFKEGETYSLYVPFGEYDGSGDFIQYSCEGYAVLEIKIVPEYLTWQGDGSDVWYNDDNWNQSTEGELYFDQGLIVGTSTDDANGSDPDLTKAFAPLYFTKITINPKQDNDVVTADQLNLLKETKTTYTITSDGTTNTYELLNFGNSGMNISLNTTLNIEYDMAVDTIEKGIKVVPYYGNKVDQIYFKPEATLMNQHYLDYQKAWVEFESIPETPYWMSSPLKGIYAGDMYAPSSNGRQETAAFTDIYYNGIHEDGTDLNSRWNPAFYQKAWDKAIRYAADADDNGVPTDAEIANVNAVKSNWSIEYNDVTVPYSLGKGFYSLVEYENTNGTTGNVLVRLPKADTEYKYETKTRALTNTGKLPGDYGRLADGSDISIDLSKEDTETTQEEVDGDGTHFLVGNPYMTYLDMSEFFRENAKEDNPVLVKKYWLLENGASKAIVGTPDVEWENNATEKDQISGFIPPMTAFFVELNKDATTKTIKFTTAMMAAKPTTTDNVYTKSYSASNPILTLTAERGETRSVARLLTSDKGHDEYEASEDAVLLLDSELDAPMVYTVAGDVAAQFNTLRSIKNVPLGIYNKKGDEVTLTISGLSRLVEPLYLYDAWTGKSKELTGDSYQLTVEGEGLGRYYLRNEALASELESTISIYSLQPGEIVAASSGAALRQVRVYSVNGELVTQRSAVGQTACRLSVPRGAIYMIYAEDTKGNSQSVKLRVR